jgi:hypothetical protein
MQNLLAMQNVLSVISNFLAMSKHGRRQKTDKRPLFTKIRPTKQYFLSIHKFKAKIFSDGLTMHDTLNFDCFIFDK